MNTLLVILGIVGGIVATYLFLLYKGKIKDSDGDFIPDVVEDKVDDIKEDVAEAKAEVKRRVKRVKEELKDVKEAGKNLAKQSKDVVEAVRESVRRRLSAGDELCRAGVAAREFADGDGAVDGTVEVSEVDSRCLLLKTLFAVWKYRRPRPRVPRLWR